MLKIVWPFFSAWSIVCWLEVRLLESVWSKRGKIFVAHAKDGLGGEVRRSAMIESGTSPSDSVVVSPLSGTRGWPGGLVRFARFEGLSSPPSDDIASLEADLDTDPHSTRAGVVDVRLLGYHTGRA